MDIHNKAELELYFAENMSTVLFPVLADIYFQEEDYTRARKVCEIGLSNNPDQPDGLFVLANVTLAEGQITEAERLLKTLKQTDTTHLQASVLLAQVQEALGRSPNTILKSWEAVLTLDPYHEQGKKTVSDLKKKKKVKPQPKPAAKKTKTPEKQVPTSEPIESLSISPKLATFTLVSVLKNQGLFYQALDVLAVLKEKGEDADRIAKEIENIENLINSHAA